VVAERVHPPQRVVEAERHPRQRLPMPHGKVVNIHRSRAQRGRGTSGCRRCSADRRTPRSHCGARGGTPGRSLRPRWPRPPHGGRASCSWAASSRTYQLIRGGNARHVKPPTWRASVRYGMQTAGSPSPGKGVSWRKRAFCVSSSGWKKRRLGTVASIASLGARRARRRRSGRSRRAGLSPRGPGRTTSRTSPPSRRPADRSPRTRVSASKGGIPPRPYLPAACGVYPPPLFRDDPANDRRAGGGPGCPERSLGTEEGRRTAPRLRGILRTLRRAVARGGIERAIAAARSRAPGACPRPARS
jgi:hypothetical protein